MRSALSLVLAAAAAIVILGCGETEEVTQSEDSSPTSTAAATAVATPSPVLDSPTPSASSGETPLPASETPVPTSPTPEPSSPSDDWQMYERAGLFTVRYPSDWFISSGSLLSFDPVGLDQPALPQEAIKIDISANPDDGVSGCGVISVDKSGEETVPQEASPTMLADASAWRIIREGSDPLLEGGLTRIEAISSIHMGYCFTVTAYFTQEQPDTVIFEEVLERFEFTL